MKRKRLALALFVTMLLVASALTGCAGKGQSGGTSSATAPNQNASDSQSAKDVTLRISWWGPDDRNKATMDAINQYMKENPHVKIQGEYMDYNSYYDKLVTQLAGGTAPDMMVIVDRWYYDLAQKNHFLSNLGDYKAIDFSTLDPNFLKTQKFNGQNIGFPAGLQGAVLLYNKNFFNKFNIPEDTKWTWDNIISIGQKVHQQDPSAYLFSTDTGELGTLLRTYQKQLTGNQWIKDDYTPGFNKDVLTKMFTFEKKLYDSNAAEPMSKAIVFLNKSYENPDWINGNLGMQYKLISLIPSYKQDGKFSLGVAPLPTMEGMKDTGVFNGSTLVYVMNKATKYPEETAKFLNWMVNNPEAIKILGTTRGIPATQKARDLLKAEGKIDPLVNDALNTSLKTTSKILPDNAISQNQILDQIFLDTIEKVGYNKLTPEQAADEMLKQYNEKLKELKQ